MTALATPARLEGMLVDAGMPAELAAEEARNVNPDMKRSILRLYRSAKRMSDEWATDLSGLSNAGLVMWGEADPYVPMIYAERFCTSRGVPLHVEKGAAHWAVCERPEAMAKRLKAHWDRGAS